MTLTMADIIVEQPEDGEILDPMSWFETPGPFELEIGSGKGGFLLRRAEADPSLRLLGVEWANKFFKYCADRMARWNLTNVRVMRTDAKYLVERHLPSDCVSVLHIYHPDPWPKKRHHKRRLIHPDFVEAVARILKPGGLLLLQTDHEPYFYVMKEVLAGNSRFESIDPERTGIELGGDWAGTNFEIKYAKEGRAIYRVAYSRV